jgi:uncharacterized protein (DUF1697 family)
MGTYVALLRGVNVGGNAIVKMKDVKAAFEDAGLRHVETYINSGNIIFESAKKDVRALERLTGVSMRERCGVPCAVVVKSAGEYEAIVRALPASWVDDEEWRCNVIFLRHTVDSKKVLDELGAKDEIEELVYCPGAVLWRARRDALTRSNVARLNRRPLYQEITVRNLNTTRKLWELMSKRA